MERSVSQYVIAQSAVCKGYESSGRHVMECDGMKWKKRNVSGIVTPSSFQTQMLWIHRQEEHEEESWEAKK